MKNRNVVGIAAVSFLCLMSGIVVYASRSASLESCTCGSSGMECTWTAPNPPNPPGCYALSSTSNNYQCQGSSCVQTAASWCRTTTGHTCSTTECALGSATLADSCGGFEPDNQLLFQTTDVCVWSACSSCQGTHQCGVNGVPTDFCQYESGCPSGSTLNQNCCYPPESPIILDIGGDGFTLTDTSNGVYFDLRADGHPVRTAWISQDANNAWLTLDRNQNGVIDNGAELFGNVTPQPPSPTQNGFLALAVFDLPANGGNGDGLIDGNDAVFAQLRLWKDANHNGTSEPSELFPLGDAGISAIRLDYKESKFEDLYGNQFRYRARVEMNTQGKKNKWAYDVFLKTAP